jgi:hypothetical protein
MTAQETHQSMNQDAGEQYGDENAPKRYADVVDRGAAKYGERFDESGLIKEFRRYYESGRQVQVRFAGGPTLTGTIGISAGAAPTFMLMPLSGSAWSADMIGPHDEVIAVF